MFLLQRRIVRERTVSCGCVRSANGALTLFVPISMRPSSEEPHEAIPAIEPVANRFGRLRYGGDRDNLGFKPGLQRLDERLRLGPAHICASRRCVLGFGFDDVEYVNRSPQTYSPFSRQRRGGRGRKHRLLCNGILLHPNIEPTRPSRLPSTFTRIGASTRRHLSWSIP